MTVPSGVRAEGAQGRAWGVAEAGEARGAGGRLRPDSSRAREVPLLLRSPFRRFQNPGLGSRPQIFRQL